MKNTKNYWYYVASVKVPLFTLLRKKRVSSCKSKTTFAYLPSYIDSPSSKLNDGFWHQIVAVWSGGDKSWIVYIDGVSQGWKPHPSWTTDSIQPVPPGATLKIGQLPLSLSADSSKSFLGRITLFNMWDHTLETSKLAMLGRGCRDDPGNLFSWSTLKSSAGYGQLKIIEPSSCMYYWGQGRIYFRKGFLFDSSIGYIWRHNVTLHVPLFCSYVVGACLKFWVEDNLQTFIII